VKRIVVLISGRGRNLQSLIEASLSGELPGRIVAVISNRADAQGLVLAKAAGIPGLVIAHTDYPSREAFDEALLQAIQPLQPDAVVLAGFMRILTPAFIRAFEGRLLNIHPSLLPLYPGLHTHARAIAAGDAEHGATVHFVTEQLDGGPALIQGRLSVRPEDTAEALARRVLEEIELRIYPQALRLLLNGEMSLDAGQPLYQGQPLEQPLQV
jgi:phosphoribosylglycinamide formyltransferase 1